jgi:AcrR family transcriptional regulator
MRVRRVKSAKLRIKERRQRRSPEDARALILAAAQRVFGARGPDAAGLKEVAREACVSHALVTHYFGTYDRLVEAALEDSARRVEAQVLARLASVDAGVGPVAQLIEAFFDAVSQPLHGRLVAYAVLSGRVTAGDFFARRVQGPRHVADAIMARLASHFPAAGVDRREIEHAIILVMGAAFGLGMGHGVLWGGLGLAGDEADQARFRGWLTALVQGHMSKLLAPPM